MSRALIIHGGPEADSCCIVFDSTGRVEQAFILYNEGNGYKKVILAEHVEEAVMVESNLLFGERNTVIHFDEEEEKYHKLEVSIEGMWTALSQLLA